MPTIRPSAGLWKLKAFIPHLPADNDEESANLLAIERASPQISPDSAPAVEAASLRDHQSLLTGECQSKLTGALLVVTFLLAQMLLLPLLLHTWYYAQPGLYTVTSTCDPRMLRSAPKPNERWLSARLPLIATAHRAQCERLIRGDPSASFAQANQDWFLFHNFFADMNGPGTYLDIGANDAKLISNSFFFDVCLGWTGVCVEPNPVYAESYNSTRSCRLLSQCVSNERKQTAFIFDGFFGHINNRTHPSATTTTANCVTIPDILREHADILGMPDGEGALGSLLNYVSFDVEGFEPDIIACLDFAGLSSRPVHDGPGQVWTVETNKANEGLVLLDSAFALGGFVKSLPLLHVGGSLLDHVYEMDRTRLLHRTPQMVCEKEVGSRTCNLVDLMHGLASIRCPNGTRH